MRAKSAVVIVAVAISADYGSFYDKQRANMKLKYFHGKTPEQFQAYILPSVSRTFSLTIPQLPMPLRRVIGNFYLLCRAVDTIEDDPELDINQKQHYGEWLVDVITNRRNAEEFVIEVAPLISKQMPKAERELMQQLPLVIKVTQGFHPLQRETIECCVNIMSNGMHYFQGQVSKHGLNTQRDLYSYCYYVSGVVGEALTELFCHHSTQIACNRKEMLELAPSFGLGLQITNILIDHWDDRRQGQCWLPRDLFAHHNIDLSNLRPEQAHAGYDLAIRELIGIAHAHLRIALQYTLLIPSNESGVRYFCYWIISLAILSLKNMYLKLDFKTANEIKARRIQFARVITLTKISRCDDVMLIKLFNQAAANLPLNSLTENWGKATEWPSCNKADLI